MARTKNTPHGPRSAARSAAHAAPAATPAPGGPPPGSLAGAVHAALAAHPGGVTTAVIADAIGTSRTTARDALTELETAGGATRTKGGKPGVPDTWALVAAEEAGHEPGTGPSQTGEPMASLQPEGAPAAGDQDGPGEQAAAGDPSEEETSAGRPLDAAPGGEAAAPPDKSPGEPDTDTGPQGVDEPTGDAEPGPSGPAAHDNPATGELPDPALVAEVAGHIKQIQAAASATTTVLASDGNLRAARAGLDEIYEQAAQARRTLKSAVGGKKAPPARPGGLREKILGHLRAHPGANFTPHDIHKVLGNSSGAIANALDTLVKHGDAELATEKPRRFRLTAAPAPTPDRPPTEAEGTGAGDDTDLAGAA